jgi:hypothetical protein
MQARTTPPDEPGAIGDDRLVEREVETVRTQQRVAAAPVGAMTPPRAVSSEREVETVRTRQRVAGTPVDAMPPPRAVPSALSGRYLETLPERLGAVMVALLTGLEGLMGMRFLLRAYGANPSSGFVGFINDVSWLFVRPFANAFNNRSWSQGVVEISTLVAMGFYLLLFALIAMLITALAPRLRGGSGG